MVRWASAVVSVGLPFVSVGGDSALRFDVPTLRLHFFGATLWMNEAFILLLATLALTLVFLLVTVAGGRVWCGWGCPQTLLADLTAPLERWRRAGGGRALTAVLGVAALSAVVGVSLVGYVVSPYELLPALVAGELGPVAAGSCAALGLLVFVDLVFWRQRFCVTACPYAKLQGALFDEHTLVVAYDDRRASDCIDCGACVRACPTDIDIRAGVQAACIACAACIDACEPIMARLQRPPHLVGYVHGAPGRTRRLLRPGVVALAVASLLAVGAAVTAAATRADLDVLVSPASMIAPRRTASGGAANAFTVALENHGAKALSVIMSVSAAGQLGRLRPGELTLAVGEHRRLTVVAELDRVAPGRLEAEVTVTAGGRSHTRTVPFFVPEAP